MYQRFFALRECPFALLPDPDFLFLGEKHRAALDLLELTIVNQCGFCVLSGEVGAGKTTLVRELLRRLGNDFSVGLVSNTHAAFGELMQWIAAAFGLPTDGASGLELHQRFVDFVIQRYAARQRTLLIIDEAQNLSAAALEELRMLSNLNSDKDFVLQVILVGQAGLREKLTSVELVQFAQRIAVDYHLPALDAGETGRYIAHRLTHAGAASALFDTDACRMIHRASGGIPRLINRICDLSLVYAYAQAKRVVTPDIVAAVVRDQDTGGLFQAVALAPPDSAGPGRGQTRYRAISVDLQRDEAPLAAVSGSAAGAAPRGSDTSESAAAAHAAVPADRRSTRSCPTGTASAPVCELHRLVVDAEAQQPPAPLRVWAVAVSSSLLIAALAGWLFIEPLSLLYAAAREQLAAAPAAAAHGGVTPASQPPQRLPAESAASAHPPADRQPSAVVHAGSAPPARQPAPADNQSAAAGGASPEQPARGSSAPLAEDEELRRELERLQRLKHESESLERQRRVAAQQLAAQRRARELLEQEARLERERIRAVQAGVAGIATERARIAARSGQPLRQDATVTGGKPPPPLGIDPPPPAQPGAPARSVSERSRSSESRAATATDGVGASQPRVFVPNPCNGPTARFLSTCF